MLRVAIRGSVIVLALMFAIAGAGTVMCEMDCAAGSRTQAAAAMSDRGREAATSHCDGEQMESARHDMPSPDGNSGGPTKHTGAHLHPRIVATATARIHISPALTFSDFVATPVSFGSAIFARIEANFRSNNSSPPINYPSVYSSSVLRI